MAKETAIKILDSDMHVFEPHDLYVKYMDPQMGRAHPARHSRANKHGQIKFTFADGRAAASFGNPSASRDRAQDQQRRKRAGRSPSRASLCQAAGARL